MRVLLIEASHDDATAFQQALQVVAPVAAVVRVPSLRDGLLALEAANGAFDAVVSDLYLPGARLSREVETVATLYGACTRARIPLVVLTAEEPLGGWRATLVGAGAERVVRKRLDDVDGYGEALHVALVESMAGAARRQAEAGPGATILAEIRADLAAIRQGQLVASGASGGVGAVLLALRGVPLRAWVRMTLAAAWVVAVLARTMGFPMPQLDTQRIEYLLGGDEVP
jgi:CheY-like chemotaxis protein